MGSGSDRRGVEQFFVGAALDGVADHARIEFVRADGFEGQGLLGFEVPIDFGELLSEMSSGGSEGQEVFIPIFPAGRADVDGQDIGSFGGIRWDEG